MRWLIVGHGSREHALVRRLRAEDQIVVSYLRRPNPAILKLASKLLYGEYAPDVICAAAVEAAVDVVVVAQEQTIFNGVADHLQAQGIYCFAPSLGFVDLERRKPIAKNLVRSLSGGARVAPFIEVASVDEALAFVRNYGPSVVVKSATVTAGTPVSFPVGQSELETALRKQLQLTGSALVEQFVEGIDFSVFCFAAGGRRLFLDTVRDYPFKYPGNKGPKTGGMGCVSSSGGLPYLTRSDVATAYACIGDALAVQEYRAEASYEGAIVGQFIKAESGDVFFNEFDIRLGDPETINLLARTKTSFAGMVESVRLGASALPEMTSVSVVSICHVPPRYPKPGPPLPIRLVEGALDDNDIFVGDLIYHDGAFWTGKGRALTVVGIDGSLDIAQQKAVAISEELDIGLYFRRDIGRFSSHSQAERDSR